MEVSFSLTPTTLLTEHAKIVAQAEACGFDLAWCPDQGFMRDPFASIAYTAALTKIPLGLAVVNPFSRHPLQIARAIGTLADLRKEGVILGVGAGELLRMRRKMGAPEAPLIDTLRASIVAMRALLAGEEVSIDHPVFKLDKVRLEFKPTAQVPLYIASTSFDAFALAGEIADGVIVGDIADPEVIRNIVRTVRESAVKAGRDPKAIKIVAWVSTLLTDSQEETYELLRLPVVGRAVSNAARKTREALQVPEEVIGEIKRSLQNGDKQISKSVVSDRLVDAMTLVGTAESVTRRSLALRDAGVDVLGCRMPVALANRYPFEQNLRKISETIIPALKSGSSR
ncbi:MAG: LLM class flavin-dependent oxidoreductase [Xanthobacteraceae bacterium]|jgi:5,10-methylenetetrahydromethanopterin reductase